MPLKYPYRDLGVPFDRNFRNDLNANFDDIENDMRLIGGEAAQQALEAAHEAKTQAIYAQEQGDYAQDKGDYASEQGDYAKTQGDYAQQATIDANNAANNANDKANLADQKATLAQEKVNSLTTLETQLNQAITDSQTATTNANTSASNANDKANYAQQQGDYAKSQGDYAKQQGDAANLAVNNANEAITNANSAITNANEAANNANSAANNAQTVVDNTKFIEPYNPETTYQKNNIVSYNGSSFIAKQTTTGNTPIGDANDVYWGLLAQRGVDGQGAVNSVNNILPDVNGNINITATDVGSIPISQKGVPNGVASIDENGRVLDGNGNVVEGKVTSVNGHIGDVNLNANDVGAISASEKGVANGVALLNADGKVVDSNGNLVEGKVTSVNGQIGDVNITAADVGAETPDEAQAKADTAEQNAKNYTDQQISGKVSTQAVMLRNTTTITTVESSAPVGIADYNPSTDFLLVVKNSVVLTEGEEYTIDTANKAIVNTQGSWDGTANPINFLFIVYKNVAGSIDYYDGELLLDGTVTDSKLASDNKIGSLAELTTTDKTSVVNAINENKQQIDLHADDTTIHITSAERTAWNNAEANAKAYTDQQLSTHTADTTTGAHKAKNIAVEDANNHFTGTDVESVLNELFTFANDGKTAVANAITAKGVSASPSDTFAALATKIGQISIGKKYASGTVTSSSSLSTYYFVDQYTTTPVYLVTVTGLSFKPSIVVVNSNNSNSRCFSVLSTNLFDYYLGQNKAVVRMFDYNSSGSLTTAFDLLPKANDITSSSFTVPVLNSNQTYEWYAYE